MTGSHQQQGGPRVAVVGGGLAGLAAAAALCRRGFRVELFEARRRLGGRAGSFHDPESGELVDHCQHVAMGCCTNLAHFCRTTGVADCFGRRRRLNFIGPDGRRYAFSASPLVPAPFHLLAGLIRLGYLRPADRLRILRTIRRLAAAGSEDRGVTIGSWLRNQGESDQAVERFWAVVLVSALSETLDRISLAAARKVFLDGFLASRRAYELEIPQLPLDHIYNRRVAEWLARQDVAVHRGVRVRQIAGDARRAEAVILPDGSRRPFDFLVVAVPWRNVRALFSEAMLRALPSLEHVDRIESAAITAVHLWLDRRMTSLPDAVLVGRLSQWLFNRGRQVTGPKRSDLAYYYQVVISASGQLRGQDRREVVARVRKELAEIWPAARSMNLLRWRVVDNPEAVFSPQPGIDRFRPLQRTAIANLMLAGDWTATGWPATMEGAVRSGYLAAEAVVNSVSPGSRQRLLVPDLPRGPLARSPVLMSAF